MTRSTPQKANIMNKQNLIETTTRSESKAGIKWAYNTFSGIHPSLYSRNWIKVPGHYDYTNGTTTNFSMYRIEEAFGMSAFVDILQYKTYSQNSTMHQQLLLNLILKAVDIRYKHCQSKDKFLLDYDFYYRIRSSIDDKDELERIKNEIVNLKKEIHWPHFFDSLTSILCLLNILLAIPNRVSEIISNITARYPASPEVASEFRAYVYSMCDHSYLIEYDDEEEEFEEFEGYQAGTVHNQPFKDLLAKLL